MTLQAVQGTRERARCSFQMLPIHCIKLHVFRSEWSSGGRETFNLQFGECGEGCCSTEWRAAGRSGCVPETDPPLVHLLSPRYVTRLLVTGAKDEPEPTRVLRLGNMVSEQELANDEEYEDILVDVREEMSSHGEVVKVVIPRPSATVTTGDGIGAIFVEFVDTDGCKKAFVAMTGRQFAGKTVVASYYDETRFGGEDLE